MWPSGQGEHHPLTLRAAAQRVRCARGSPCPDPASHCLPLLLIVLQYWEMYNKEKAQMGGGGLF